MSLPDGSSPETASAPSINLAEVRQQIVEAVGKGDISSGDVTSFTELLHRQLETGSVSPVAIRAGQLAEQAFGTDPVLTTPGDIARSGGAVESRSLTGGGRVDD